MGRKRKQVISKQVTRESPAHRARFCLAKVCVPIYFTGQVMECAVHIPIGQCLRSPAGHTFSASQNLWTIPN